MIDASWASGKRIALVVVWGVSWFVLISNGCQAIEARAVRFDRSEIAVSQSEVGPVQLCTFARSLKGGAFLRLRTMGWVASSELLLLVRIEELRFRYLVS